MIVDYATEEIQHLQSKFSSLEGQFYNDVWMIFNACTSKLENFTVEYQVQRRI